MASAQLIKRQPAPTREFTGTITERMPVMGDAWLVTFTAPKELCAAARAGNFVNVLPHDHDVFDPPLRRPREPERYRPDGVQWCSRHR